MDNVASAASSENMTERSSEPEASAVRQDRKTTKVAHPEGHVGTFGGGSTDYCGSNLALVRVTHVH